MNNLSIVREACVKADPEIDRYCSLSKRVDGKTHSEFFDGDDPYTICSWCGEIRSAPLGMVITPGRGEPRPIRLADVLVAIEATIPTHCLFVSGSGRFYEERAGQDIQLAGGQWNLLQDDLEKQSSATIDFLASLLNPSKQ